MTQPTKVAVLGARRPRRSVFEKEFRDATDGTRACYQAVVEAPVQFQRVETGLSARDWRIEVHPLDSHPIGRELGIADQEAALAFDFEMDFVLENGYEVAGGAVLSGAPPNRRPPASPNGSGSVIEATARWLWREVTALERASLDWLRRI